MTKTQTIVLCAGAEIVTQLLLYSTVFHHRGISNPMEGIQEIILEISLYGSEPMMPQANSERNTAALNLMKSLQVDHKYYCISAYNEPLKVRPRYTALS